MKFMAHSLFSLRLLPLYGSLIIFCLLFLAASDSNYWQCLKPFLLSGDGFDQSHLAPIDAEEAAASHLPTVEIFAAPFIHGRGAGSTAVSADDEKKSLRAMMSWLDSILPARLTLMGEHPSVYGVADRLRRHLRRRRRTAKVCVEPNIDHTFRGTPQIHSMLARAQQSDANISLLVLDAESTVFSAPIFADALYSALRVHQDWVLFSRAASAGDGDTLLPDSRHVLFWAWNNNDHYRRRLPLFTSPVPPFANLNGGDHHSDTWILSHIIREAHPRAVIDATDARIVTASTADSRPKSGSNNYIMAPTSESRINLLLSEAGIGKSPIVDGNGSSNHSGTVWRMKRCAESDQMHGLRSHSFCLIAQQKQKENVNRSSATTADDIDRYWPGTAAGNTHQSPETSITQGIDGAGFMYNLEGLLPQVADENRVVVMVGGTSNYKEMLMSFVCRAAALGIKSVLVAAFDDSMLEFAYLQGLAVYKENVSEAQSSVISSDTYCLFASDCFKRVSKLKSASVLRVLKLGYSVLWSDMDIYWFKNPVQELKNKYGAGTLVIQSDELDENKPENTIRGANSGFYLARSDEATVAAVEAIVRHAMGTDMTEQPSFYDVLCGEKGERRVGKRGCRWRSSGNGRRRQLRTVFLSHRHYPNGYVYRLWESSNTLQSCHSQGCVILHNNYIQGKANKMVRFIERGMWFYDAEAGMCLQPWNPLSPSRLPLPDFAAHFRRTLRV